MAKDKKYIIRIDGSYLVGFDGKQVSGKTSHNGWSQLDNEMGEVQLSVHETDAKVFDGNINLKSGLDKLYDRMRYGGFSFDRLEVYCEYENNEKGNKNEKSISCTPDQHDRRV